MKNGRIIKGIAGFYYVKTRDSNVYECKAKGIFRKDNLKPLVGDMVEIEIIDETEKTGNIEKILPRFNTLIRPAVANIDMALVIFAIKKPNPNLNLLDRFLITMEEQEVETIICFNKTDLADSEELDILQEAYSSCGYKVLCISAEKREGTDKVLELLNGKTTTVAGPSGVGKSTLINSLLNSKEMETGEISEKIDRGKHTTRHSQLLEVNDNTYIVDTPGFSSLFIEDFEYDELKNYYSEFVKYENNCRFAGCLHLKEPDCAVKEALAKGKISRVRYDNYVILAEELKNKKKY